MRLRLEFTTEPFDLDEPPAHAMVAREVVLSAPLETVEVGPFGNTAVGAADAVLAAVDELLRRSLSAGATRISLQVNAIAERPGAGPRQEGDEAHGLVAGLEAERGMPREAGRERGI